jgi:hypothetical protein
MYIVSISASTWYNGGTPTASNNNQTRMRTKEPLFRASYDNGKTFRKRVSFQLMLLHLEVLDKDLPFNNY